MASKSTSLNIWDVETKTKKLDIECHSTYVSLTADAAQELQFYPAVVLKSALNGDIELRTKFGTVDAAIATANNDAAANLAVTNGNLAAYISSNDASLATVSATVTSNKAISDANHASDAADRVALEAKLQTAIDDEEARALAAEAVNAANIVNEGLNRAIAVNAEEVRAIAAEGVVQAGVDVEKARIDAMLAGSTVDLDTLAELVAAYEAADVSVLNTITALQTQVTALQATVDELTA